MKPVLLALLLIALTGTGSLAERLSLRPVDQAGTDPDLVAVRATLLAAAKARDLDALRTAACAPVIDALTATPALWSTLADTLEQPGAFADASTFTQPYHWQFPLPASVDPATAYIVNATNVRLRARPNSSGRVLAGLSYEVLSIRDFTGPRSYQRAVLGDGTEGWVFGRFLVPLLGAKADFKRDDTGWRLCAFDPGS